MDVLSADLVSTRLMGQLAGLLLIKVTVIITAAWLASKLLQGASAAVRHAVWGIAFCSILLLPVLGAVVPRWEVTLPSVFFDQWPMAGMVEQQDAAADASVSEAPISNRLANDARKEGLQGAIPVIPAAHTEEAAANISAWSLAGGAMVLIWVLGIVVIIGRLMADIIRVFQISRTAHFFQTEKPIVDATPVGGSGYDLNRGIRVAYSSRVKIPVNWGLIRPVILLPEAARTWPDERLNVVLQHELAHITRWDYFTHLLTQVACALYWLNPIVWLAARKIHVEQEQACDDKVLASGVPSYEYADQLLAILQSFRAEDAWVRGAVAMGQTNRMKERIGAILDGHTDRRPLTIPAGLLILALSGFIVLPLAALQMAHASAPPATFEYVWLEAEDGWLQQPMRIVNDVGASRWQYIEVQDDKNSYDEPPENGYASYQFEVAEAGVYQIWGRVIACDEHDDSFWVRVDNGPWIKWRGIAHGREWHWDLVHDWDQESRTVLFELSAGTHFIDIAYREDDTKLDRLLITNDLNYRPRGRGVSPEDLTPVHIQLEPEDGRLHAPMTVRSAGGTSGVQYVTVPDGPGNDAPHGGRGYVDIPFEVPADGHYVVWGRIRAPYDNDNSFYISIDGGEEVRWHVPGPFGDKITEEWMWDPVSTGNDRADQMTDPVIYHLNAGRHILRVRNREDGTLLDRIVITNTQRYSAGGTVATAESSTVETTTVPRSS